MSGETVMLHIPDGPSCMVCGKHAVMLTDRLCAPCFDATWDAQIDAEADRLEGRLHHRVLLSDTTEGVIP